MISEDAAVRKYCREYLRSQSMVTSAKAKEKVKKAEDEDDPVKSSSYSQQSDKKSKDVYQIYHDFKAPARSVKPHQILALNRGEEEGYFEDRS
jgi:transcriptional accessory protein Tex/SPT6